jgi:hypothetical protein
MPATTALGMMNSVVRRGPSPKASGSGRINHPCDRFTGPKAKLARPTSTGSTRVIPVRRPPASVGFAHDGATEVRRARPQT